VKPNIVTTRVRVMMRAPVRTTDAPYGIASGPMTGSCPMQLEQPGS